MLLNVKSTSFGLTASGERLGVLGVAIGEVEVSSTEVVNAVSQKYLSKSATKMSTIQINMSYQVM